MHVRQMRQIFVNELDKYIIIDTHGGEEDIIGIATTLKLAEKFNKIVLGITCVNGRRSVDKAARDALIAQKIAGTKVPVIKGSVQSILMNNSYPECYNFADNSAKLDQIEIDSSLESLIQSDYAPIWISKQIKKYTQQLCIITFGPLTNIGLAFHNSQNVKVLSTVRINGGAFTGVGNVKHSSSSQGNFYCDPQAAHMVISNYKNVYINPIETTLQTNLSLFFKEISSTSNQTLKQLLNILQQQQLSLCGPLLTIFPIFERQIASKVMNVYSQVMNTGNNIVGLMAPNWLRLQVPDTQQIPNTKIYSYYDLQAAKKLLKLAFQN